MKRSSDPDHSESESVGRESADTPTPASSEPEIEPMQTSSHNSRPSTPAGDNRALKILAKSVYRELRSSGHSRSDIVGFTNALLELVTSDIKEEPNA